jgi:hypothetical protein
LVGAAVRRTNPRFDGVIPPRSTERVLVLEKATDSFEKRLHFTFDWVLVLMSRGGGANGNAVVHSQMVSGRSCVFRGAGVAAKVANPVSVQSVEGDDLFCGFEERGGGFVFNEDGMAVATEKILVEEEAGVPSDGSGINEALVVYTDSVGGEETVDSRAETSGIAVPFCQSACGTVEV